MADDFSEVEKTLNILRIKSRVADWGREVVKVTPPGFGPREMALAVEPTAKKRRDLVDEGFIAVAVGRKATGAARKESLDRAEWCATAAGSLKG